MSEKSPSTEPKPRFTITHDEAITTPGARADYLSERFAAQQAGLSVWKIRNFEEADSDLSGLKLHYFTEGNNFPKGYIHGNELDGWKVYTLSWEDEGYEEQEHATPVNVEMIENQLIAEILLESIIADAPKSR